MLKSTVKVIGMSWFLTVALMVPAHAQDAISPGKRASIKELLTVTNAEKNVDTIAKLTLTQAEATLPNILIAVLPQLAAESIQKSNELVLPKVLGLMQEIINEELGKLPSQPK